MRSGMILGMAMVTIVWGALALPAQVQDFGYSGEIGPEHWADLRPEWGTCSTGQEQSPVDLGGVARRLRRSARPVIDYPPTRGKIFNNGHTIEVETEGEDALTLDGERYRLVQLHFHSPSEHTVQGRGYDMEMHLVHRSDAGRIAVLGIFLQRGPDSGAFDAIGEALPDDIDVRHAIEDPLDLRTLLPATVSSSIRRYAGSLTTPPCSEDVSWLVATEPVLISDELMARFVERVRYNARFVQRFVRSTGAVTDRSR